MATPHVAGAAAVYLAGHTSATPAQVATALVGGATSNVLTSVGTGSPNKLLKLAS
ncbi:subtilase family protein [Streptomyces sp. Ag109_O5-1]|nr:subtilase family protein [Streptomyces sp. Ag109_O5-1]